MTDAEKAYQAAKEEIAWVRETGGQILNLSDEAFSALEVIPPEIAELDGLKWLELNKTQVSDLSPLANMTALEALYLNRTQVSDLSHLANMTTLERIALDQTQVSDLSPLANMTALKTLDLFQTQVSDLSPLANMTALETLHLALTQVSDLSHLENMTALETLTLNQTQVSDLSPLANMTALKTLDLDQTQVHDLRPIQNLTKLEDVGFLNGLLFTNTPFARATPETARLAAIEDDQQRARETLAFLRTLPPYPEPLPWESTTGEAAAPIDTKPDRPIKPLSLSAARRVLTQDHPLMHDRCQAVVAEIQDAQAMLAVRIPNEPKAQEEHRQLTDTLKFAEALIVSIHDALPAGFTDQPVTETDVSKLRNAFNDAIEKLQKAAEYIDRPDHTPTYGGLLKMGCAGSVASVVAIATGTGSITLLPVIYACLYGPAAAKGIKDAFIKPMA